MGHKFPHKDPHSSGVAEETERASRPGRAKQRSSDMCFFNNEEHSFSSDCHFFVPTQKFTTWWGEGVPREMEA